MPPTPNELPQDFTFRHELRDGYLYVHVSGPKNTYRVMRSYALQLAQLLKEVPVNRVLIEIDFPPAPTVHDVFDIINDLDEIGLSKKIFGVVDKHVSHQEVNSFAEMVASNRRMKIVVFDNAADAEEWLLIQ